MKRNFVVGLFGGLIGSLLLFVLLSAAGSVGARGQERSGLQVPDQSMLASTPLSSTFTYQGQLKNNGNPINGSCQMAFRLYDDPSSSTNLIGSPITTTVPVANGLFTVGLNFGSNVFDGNNGRWLDIQVDCGSGFVALTPRQALTPVPYAFALPGLYTTQNITSPNVVGGYSGNIISSTAVGSVIGGGGSSGSENRAQGNYATAGGGYSNTVSANIATVGGGANNVAGSPGAFVGGGESNTASGHDATVGGGWLNTAMGYVATVPGGDKNSAQSDYATIGGGENNLVTATYGTIAGGFNITVTGRYGTVGGGYSNTVSANIATVGGGANNIANGPGAFVGGGESNTASGHDATVGGGYLNTAIGYGAAVPGGDNNSAQGYDSLAAGRQAKANHAGAFVWADSTGIDFASTGANQFLIRAEGGVGIGTNAPQAQLDVSGTIRVRQTAGVGVTNLCLDPLGMLAPCVSSQRYKNNVAALTLGLDTIAQLRPVTFDWKGTGEPDLGFVAEEVDQVTPLLTTRNADGQIEGVKYDRISAVLVNAMQEQQQQIAAQQKEISDLQARLTNLDPNAPPASFNLFNMLSVIAFAGFACMWLQQRRSKRGES